MQAVATPNENVTWEQRKRQEAVDFARASVGLDGFKPSAAAEALAARFIGEGCAEIVLRQVQVP